MNSSVSAQHVAVAVIYNKANEILLTLRPDHVHQGGLWEFPGGKVEPNEDTHRALMREIHEELGINITCARPLIKLHHNYPDKSVLLDVWKVSGFSGEPYGKENQCMEWVPIQQLTERNFPAANRAIVTAVNLPSIYLITPEPDDIESFLATLESRLKNGIRMVQLRARSLDDDQYLQLAKEASELCHRYHARLLINNSPDMVNEVTADGVHLTSRHLMAIDRRPLGRDKHVAASCHNIKELRKACQIGVDFVVLSPVLPTASHPGADVLEWDGFKALTEVSTIPVYALGGMSPVLLDKAYVHGAQGIAAITALWKVQ